MSPPTLDFKRVRDLPEHAQRLKIVEESFRQVNRRRDHGRQSIQ